MGGVYLDLFLARRAGEAVGWKLTELEIGLKVGVGRGDDRDALLRGKRSAGKVRLWRRSSSRASSSRLKWTG